MSLFDKKYLKRIDWVTVGIVLALVVFGTIALASVQAKPFDGTEHGIADYMDKLNMEYLQKHITNFLVGLAAMIIFLVFDYSIFKTFAMWAYIGIIGLLMLLFIFGKVRGGAQGWFVFDTLERAIQPGELSKIALIVMLSKYVSAAMDRDGRLLKFKDVMIALGITFVPFMLIVLQPDYGTAIVLLVIMVVNILRCADKVDLYNLCRCRSRGRTSADVLFCFDPEAARQNRCFFESVRRKR